MTKRTIAIPQFGTRPLLILGGERGPMAATVGVGMMFAGLAWQYRSLVAVITSVLILMIGIPTLRAIGKRDPMMFAVFSRYIKYRAHYPARSTPYCRK